MSSSINRIRATETVRNWNANFPIGTLVIFEGKEHKTDSPAALGSRDVAAIFLVGIDEPVPLQRIDVPGWERVSRRSNRSGN